MMVLETYSKGMGLGAAVSDAKRAECLSISASTNADGLPAAARDAVVAVHPIWTDKLEEYRLTLDPGHWFTFINLGFMVLDVKMNVSLAYRVHADVFGEHLTTSKCLGKSTLWHENSFTITHTEGSYDLTLPDTCNILLSGCEDSLPRRNKAN